jgi:hypothetical protein
MHNAREHFRVSYGAPNVVTIELFSGKFMGMLVDASRSTGLCSICTLKVAMLIHRRTALIATGIAAMLLLALVFLVPTFLNVDRYRPQVIS